VYAVKQDLVDRFGEHPLLQATDRADPPAGTIDDGAVDRAIADAEAEVNAHLAGRYDLPLASVPEVLKRWTCDIAFYLILGEAAGERVQKRYEDVMKSLRLVAAGELTLGVDAASQEVASNGGAQVKAGSRVFDDESLADY
jgi:phage gp36-like protein